MFSPARLPYVFLFSTAILFSTASCTPAVQNSIQCYSEPRVYKFQLSACEADPHSIGIHGLWPEWSQNCDGPNAGPYDFDVDEMNLEDIEPQMKQDWFSCPEFHHTQTWFWTHEWQKHGRCALSAELFKTPREYNHFRGGGRDFINGHAGASNEISTLKIIRETSSGSLHGLLHCDRR